MSSIKLPENNGQGWYNSPLYYDIIFDQDTIREADFLEKVFSKHAKPAVASNLRILEPACGSGRLLEELSVRGHGVTGFDVEPAMVEFSRQRLKLAGHGGSVIKQRMEKFTIPGKFDMAYCLVSTFKYLLNERDARSHLRDIARHLRAGGIYLLGFHLSNYARTRQQRECWKGSRDRIRVDCVIDSARPDSHLRLENLESTLEISENGTTKTMKTAWQFRTYDAAQVRSMLRAVPEFTLVKCYDFCYDSDQPRELEDSWEDVILVLRKNSDSGAGNRRSSM
ncbi:MAG: class I SAM-dependent methyltransferase [Verrucomicrobiales bacterium]